MTFVKNKMTGETQEINQAELGNYVKSGEYDIEARDFEFEDDVGQRRVVAPKDLKQAMNLGYKIITDEQKKKEELEEKYGNQPVKAFAVGGLGSTTFGIGPAILERTGAISPDEMSVLKESGAYTAGEVTGTIGSIILSGGTSGVAKAASTLPSAMLFKGAEKIGNRAAQNIASNIAKKTVALGVEGMVGGGAYEGVSALSEEALGDKEFNAEAILYKAGTGAVIGLGFGSAFGAGSAAISRATKAGQRKVLDRIIGQIDGDEATKAAVKKRLADQGAIEEGLLALKDPEIQALKAKYPDAPITPGMESAFRPVKQIESYLYDAPTVQGESIRRSVKDIEEYVDRNINNIWSGAKEATPQETGDLIRQTFFTKINEPRESGKVVYGAIMDEFGNAPVMQAMRTKVANKIKKSDAYRIGSEGPEIKRLLGILEDGQELTLRQAKNLQADIGASMKMARPGSAERDLLQELYDQTRMLQDNSIRQALKGSKNGEKVVKALDAANADYVRAYKAKNELGELLGVKGRDFDTVLEKLEKMSAVDLDKKFINLKKTDHAAKILEQYPEIGKLVIRNRQSQLLRKHILTGDVVNYGGLKKDLLKLTSDERALYFGGDTRSMNKFIDMLTIYEKRPKTLNPSGTDIRNEVRNLFSPKAIAQNYALAQIYKGNDSFVGKMVNKVLPNLAGVEQSANAVKNQVVTASNGFVRTLVPAATIGVLSRPNESSIRKTEKTYKVLQENPEKFVEDYMNNNRDLIEAAPQTAQALQQKVVAAAKFLQSKMPKTQEGYIGQQRQPSTMELTKFGEYVEAVESPKKVLQNVARGYVSPAQIEALKAIYPKIYAALQAEVMNRLPKSLSRSQKTQLQLLLNARVDPSMSIAGFSILQGRNTEDPSNSSKVTQMQQSSMKPTMSGLSKLEQAGRSQSSIDKVVNRA